MILSARFLIATQQICVDLDVTCDLCVKVNGNSLVAADHHRAVQVLKEAGNDVTMIVVRESPKHTNTAISKVGISEVTLRSSFWSLIKLFLKYKYCNPAFSWLRILVNPKNCPLPRKKKFYNTQECRFYFAYLPLSCE